MNETKAIINLKNLRFNFLAIRRRTKSKVMAVVKADAYGHGMIECVKYLETLKDESPEYYGVALLQEAIELRKSGVTKQPIVSFAPIKKDELSYYTKFKIFPSITSEKQIKVLSKLRLQKKLQVHININTGMGRLGINYKNSVEEILKLSKISNLVIDGVYTHFATSDEKNKSFTKFQLNRFTNVIEELKKIKIDIGTIHAANSGAILNMPNSYFEMVRPGISLYGYYPSVETTESIKLKPVMSLVSKISTLMEIQKGETIGYGRIFKAKMDMTAGTLPIGYADGLLRGLSNKLQVIINDKLFNQVGRVSMDRISINLSNEKIKEGTKVILLGKSKNHQITALDWSKILKTIPYEITCSISKRIHREYMN